MFDKNTFIIFALKYQYIVGAYCIFGLVLSGIFKEFQKLHKYQVTDFISKKILYEYIKYSFVYISIITSCLITFHIKNIYQISEKYHNLFAPECIQVVHSIFFLYTSGYILLILSKKTEEIFIKAIERETA
jgi:alpha-galactosidase